ncbi:MAG: lipid asymmetry maintenance protein MlaB [Rubrivivax sp.]
MTPALPATLTLAQARATAAQLRAALERGHTGAPWEVDAGALAEFDTSALAVLLELQRAARACGAELIVSAPPAKLRQLATLYGVEALLGLQPGA